MSKYLIIYTVRSQNKNTERSIVNCEIKSTSFGGAELEFHKTHGNEELITEIIQITIMN